MQARGAAAARQDEHGRVRDGLVNRELRLRADAEPVGPPARARWLVGRFDGRGRGGSRALGARVRHRRLDQAAGGALRSRRTASDLRHGQPLRHRRLRVEPRSDRPDREDGSRLRTALPHRRRTRPLRLDDGRPSPARRAPGSRGSQRAQDRRAEGAERSGRHRGGRQRAGRPCTRARPRARRRDRGV